MSSDAFARLAGEYPDQCDLAENIFGIIRDQGSESNIDPDVYARFLGEDEFEIRGALTALCGVGLLTEVKKVVCQNGDCEQRILYEEAITEIQEDDHLCCPGCNREYELHELNVITEFTYNPKDFEGDQLMTPLSPAEKKRMEMLMQNAEQLVEKIGRLESSRDTSAGEAQKYEMDRTIERDLQTLQGYEEEFAELAARDDRLDHLRPQEAQQFAESVGSAADELATKAQGVGNAELLEAIEKIQAKLNEPKELVATKLKLILPIIPTLVKLETELNLGRAMKRAWTNIKGIFK